MTTNPVRRMLTDEIFELLSGQFEDPSSVVRIDNGTVQVRIKERAERLARYFTIRVSEAM